MIGNIVKVRGSVCTTIFTEKWRQGRPMVDKEHNRLHQESDKTRGHQRNCPEQIEVEPRLAEKREPEWKGR